jgi:tetratricopeptide (TPR) repeat protein
VRESVEEARRAEKLDPLSAEVAQSVGLLLYYARDYDAATSQLTRALELDSSLARAHLALSRVHEARGALKPAIASVERALTLAGGAEAVWQAHLARLRALAGDRRDAIRLLDQLEASNRAGTTHLAPEYFGYLYAALGEDDKALMLLERAVAERDLGVLWLKVDPRLDRFRGEPRFQELVRRVGL